MGISAHTARGRPATRRARTRARAKKPSRARQQSCPPPCSRRVRRRSTRTAPRVARRRVSDGRPAPSSVGLADVATKDLVIARGCPPGRNWISISCVADSDQSASRICAGSAPGTGLASRSTRDEEGVGCVARAIRRGRTHEEVHSPLNLPARHDGRHDHRRSRLPALFRAHRAQVRLRSRRRARRAAPLRRLRRPPRQRPHGASAPLPGVSIRHLRPIYPSTIPHGRPLVRPTCVRSRALLFRRYPVVSVPGWLTPRPPSSVRLLPFFRSAPTP